MGALGIELVDFDTRQVWMVSGMRGKTGAAGLSLGDRALMALGLHLEVPVVTADRSWLYFTDLVDVVVVQRTPKTRLSSATIRGDGIRRP